MKTYSVTLFLCILLMVPLAVNAQGWKRFEGPRDGALPRVITLANTPDITLGTLTGAQVDPAEGTISGSQLLSSSAPRVTSELGSGKAPGGGGGGSTTPPLHTGTNFAGPVQNGYIPYSASIAVGPNHIVAMTNSQFAVYTKTGTLIYVMQDNLFFPTDVGANLTPKCYYDASGHFVLFTSQVQNPASYVNVAVSQTSDPTGTWWIYHLDWGLDGTTPTGFWGDWPTLGYDNNAIYITGNQFSFADITQASQYMYSKVRVLSKDRLFSGAAAKWTDFTDLRNADGSSAFSINAGQMLSSSTSEYLLNGGAKSGSNLTLWRIDNSSTSPTLVRVATVAVGPYTFPPAAKQPGRNSPTIITGDCRIQNLVMSNGVLYTAFGVNYGSTKTKNGAGIQFVKLSTTGTLSKNMLYYTSGIDYYYPAVSVDASGNVFMVFSRSSTSEYVSMYKTGMKTTESTLEAPTLVKAGQAVVSNSKWGDYNGIHTDPSDAGAVWMYSAWQQSNGTWGSWIASTSFGVAPANQPAQGITESSARSFALIGNYPNPFNPSTTISYTLPEAMHARLVVYDAVGRVAETLIDGFQSAGEHVATFNANSFSSGIYYCRLEAGGFTQIQKMLLVK